MWKMLVGILLLGIMISAFGQQKTKSPADNSISKTISPACNLTIKNAPKLRGFYLGQTVEEITRILPPFRKAYLESDGSYYGDKNQDFRIVHLVSLYSFKELNELEDFKDVTITWQLYEGRLVRLFVTYTEFEAGSLRNFIKQASEKMSLPFNSFKITDKHKAMLTCGDFIVELHEGEYTKVGWFPSPSQIVLEDFKTIRQLEKAKVESERKKKADAIRQKQEERKQRTTLKP